MDSGQQLGKQQYHPADPLTELALADAAQSALHAYRLASFGDLPPELVQRCGGKLLTGEIGQDLEPTWIGREDWLRGHGAEGLEALDVQKVRFSAPSSRNVLNGHCSAMSIPCDWGKTGTGASLCPRPRTTVTAARSTVPVPPPAE